ncbi:PEP/pyruvate-binding domain-containing protein [Streptomyces goshikiensis]|uniref:PEP/pyruvate-binding domain-containing protein n=2 Tax=Streptomyces goshikiensis TaxID=1942 RepID=UPI00368F86AA
MVTAGRGIPFAELGRQDVGRAGGKNASLGEMTAHLASAGVRVPHEGAALDEVGAAIRSLILAEPLPAELRTEIVSAYEQLARDQGREEPEVAVRSSATAEDLPEASFAGQQETYLNVRGAAQLLESCHRCYASLFTDRAIDYRERMGFDHLSVALSVGAQVMVRSDLAGAGVMFTLDPEHYGCSMDLEWAKDGLTGDLWIVQARPETVQSRHRASTLRRCRLTATPGEDLIGPRPLRDRPTHRGLPRPRRILRRPPRLRNGSHRRLPVACPVVVRTSDFKTNEYARLLGGRPFEPVEANPMIGWRGASRYYSDGYREGLALECRALRRVRDEMGLTNVIIMIPFCRTFEEADKVLEAMAEQGLRRGANGLKVYVMAEIPANIILAQDFAERFDGFSIGSNDLTQLTLGVDRDSEALAHIFDEANPAVTRSIQILAPRAQSVGATVGLCGPRPSDDPAFTELLVKTGIDSISVAPHSFAAVKQHVVAAELKRYGTDRRGSSQPRRPRVDLPSSD